MNFFGVWGVHDVEGELDLWRLDNPIDVDLWGVTTDEGKAVVPCDNFVFDMTSTKYVRFIWPQHWGKKSATHHDWGYRAHKVPVGELMLELKPWFDSLGWDALQRVDYLNWLRGRSREAWDHDFYVLTGQEGLAKPLRWLGYRTLQFVGRVAWNMPYRGKTQIYRETGSMEAVYAGK